MQILVTGANDFVRQALVRYLFGQGLRVTALVRPDGKVAGAETVEHVPGSCCAPRPIALRPLSRFRDFATCIGDTLAATAN